MDNYEFIRRHKVNTDNGEANEASDNSQAEINTEANTANQDEQNNTPAKPSKKSLFGKKEPKEKKEKKEKPAKADKTSKEDKKGFVERRQKTPRVSSPIFEFKAPDKSKTEYDFPVPDGADFDYDWDGENLIPIGNAKAFTPVIKPASPATNTGKTATPYPAQEKKKSSSFFSSPIFWILTVFGVLVIVGITVASYFLPKRISPRDLIKVSFQGVDGYGTCVISYDEARVKKYLGRYYGELKRSEYYSDYENDWSVPYDELDIDTDTKLYDILSSLYITVDNDYELTNGDSVTLTFDYDNDYLSEEYKVRFVGEESIEKVAGLGNGTSINPFDDFNIKFTGISGMGIAEYTYTGPTDYFDEDSFSVDPMEDLSNGDTVTVSIYYDEEELLEQGLVVLQESKTYTVSGLEAYAEHYTDLSEDFIAKIKADAADTITAYAEANYTDSYSLGDLEYCGNAMGTVIFPDEEIDYNTLYMVYKSVLTPADTEIEPITVYYPVLFSNIKPSGNTYEYAGTPALYGEFTLPNGNVSAGFTDAYNCYYEVVEIQTDYNMTAYDGFETFAELDMAEDADDAASDTPGDEAGDATENGETPSDSETAPDASSDASNNQDTANKAATASETPTEPEKQIEKVKITSMSDFPGDFLTEVEDAALVTVNDYIKSDYANKLSADEPVYVGEYLLYSKNNSDDVILYCVYSVTAETGNDDDEPFDVYFPVKFTGITGDVEDNFKYAKNEGILGISDVPHSSVLSTKGFVKESRMYSDVTNNTSYNVEVAGSLSEEFDDEDEEVETKGGISY